MRILKHPILPLWCREDGAICMPPNGYKFKKFRWTFGSKDHYGYLCINFRGKKYQVHRLICEAFHGLAPVDRPTCDHFPDRNPQNNRADNLRWADMHMQNDNRQICEDSKAKYGVRKCENEKAWQKAYDAARYAKQKALGKKRRRCPDGKRRLLTDSEFSAMFS